MYDQMKSKFGPKVNQYGEDNHGRRELAYGAYKTGKTTFFSTWPSPLFIDTDASKNDALVKAHVNFIPIDGPDNCFDTVRSVLKACLTKTDIFDTGGPLESCQSIIIDSWTKLNEFLAWEIARTNTDRRGAFELSDDNLAPTDYGTLLQRQALIMMLLKEISIKRGINIGFTALDSIEGSEEEKKKKVEAKPDGRSSVSDGRFSKIRGTQAMIGQFKNRIGAEVDVIYLMDITETGQYVAYTKRRGIWQAGTRTSLPAVIINPTFENTKRTQA